MVLLQKNRERVEDIANNILELSEQTQQIGGIIETVDASIEAARAGKEGKGFAVVAMEVRQLGTAMTAIRQATIQATSSTNQAEISAKSLNEMAQQMEQAVAQYQM